MVTKHKALIIALVALVATGIYAATADPAVASPGHSCCSIRIGSIHCDLIESEKPCWDSEDCGTSQMWACCISDYCE